MKKASQVLFYGLLLLLSLVVVWRSSTNSANNHDQNRRPDSGSAPMLREYLLSKSSVDSARLQEAVPTAANTQIHTPISLADEPQVPEDPVWHNVEMPIRSLFRFPDAPTDAALWRKAQDVAARGDPLLLQQVTRHFPHPFDYLDGDIYFRQYNLPADYFLDRNHNFSVLTEGGRHSGARNRKDRVPFDWEAKEGVDAVLPPPYDFQAQPRAVIVKAGYFAFSRAGSLYGKARHFQGQQVGEAVVERTHLLRMYAPVADRIARPFVLLHAANENWGMFSTYFPNRTADWGQCCGGARKDAEMALLQRLLSDNHTLLVLTNQHYNMTHPKLLSAPRGLPLSFPNNPKIVFDAQRRLLRVRKSAFVFLAASTWGYRPHIIRCIKSKFHEQDFYSAQYSENLKGRMRQEDYYESMGRSRFGIALPGLGYDTFRLWELLTLGSIPVIEKGIGLDKSLWRLPALIVEDFDAVTPALLRAAYVEAMYRALQGAWEFERLRMSWWWQLIYDVSLARSSAPLLEKFPLESEDPGFARPRERFSCPAGGCGPGTKRTPSSYC